MIHRLFLFLFFCGFSTNLFAQQQSYNIKGVLVDPFSNIHLENGVISILNSKDSTLVTFTRAKKDGQFAIEGLSAGDYIFVASFPKYTDFVEELRLDSVNTSYDFGNVNMLLISQLLKDVVITGRNAITIKGDTIEYDASKFTIQPNSKVEDLLVQLPGIQVDKDGKITAQGQTVNKVLVDGEEFFGDDPTLVTKNIRGDMVDKVQLYDKKSDQATFTGIDDGEKTKTINIQLKEDSKNGMFGKGEAGIATDDLYQGQAMFNTFKGARKFSAYGTIANTGKLGLSWRDNDRYASSGGVQMTDDGGIMFTSSGSDEFDSFDGEYRGEGIPLAHSGGLHYDTKWNDKKESINANYKIGSLEIDGDRSTISQNSLSTGIINSNSEQDYNRFIFRQKLNARYDINFDSTSTLKVSIDGSLRNNRSTESNESTSLNGDDQLLNQSIRNNRNEGDGKNFRSSVLWNKRLRKKGRTISIGLDQSLNQNNTEGFLYSETGYYNSSGVLDSTRVIDQRKVNNSSNSTVNSSVAYTEPLSKDLTVVFNYRFNLNSGKSDLLSYNKSGNGGYNDIDTPYTNIFTLDQLTNQVGATFNYKKDKTTLNVGFSAADVNFKQIDNFNDNIMKRSFVNLNPNANLMYRVSQQKSFRLNYSGRTSQPSLHQIQPVRGNSDPLNVSIGNPNLDPAFRHSFRGGYDTYKMLSGQYMGIYVNGSFTSNAIVSDVNTNEVGQSTYKFENLKSHMPRDFSGGMHYGNKINSIDLRWGGNINFRNGTSYNIINEELNKTESNSFSGWLNVAKYVEKKYSVRIDGGPTYTSNTFSLQKERSDEGWGYNGGASANVFLPAKFEMFTDANYTFRQATQAFAENFERLIWNGGIRKKFLKTDELILSVSVNDILNQNVGFNRNAYNNIITQSNYTTIKRYFMFSLIWDFNRMGGKPE